MESTCEAEVEIDLTTCDAAGEPCCQGNRGRGTCAEGLQCDGAGVDATCVTPEPVDLTTCDAVGEPCCGTGPRAECGGGLACPFAGQGAERTCQESEDAP